MKTIMAVAVLALFLLAGCASGPGVNTEREVQLLRPVIACQDRASLRTARFERDPTEMLPAGCARLLPGEVLTVEGQGLTKQTRYRGRLLYLRLR